MENVFWQQFFAVAQRTPFFIFPATFDRRSLAVAVPLQRHQVKKSDPVDGSAVVGDHVSRQFSQDRQLLPSLLLLSSASH